MCKNGGDSIGAGRPKKAISKKTFENLCELQCTRNEICLVLDVTDKVLTRWCKTTYGMGFSEIFAQKRENGKLSLRRKQWLLADNNPAMAIFLGKNYLNQSDKKGMEESPVDIAIKEQQLEKIKAETELLKAKVELSKTGGTAEEIIQAILKMNALVSNPIQNRDIDEILKSIDGEQIINDE